MKTEEINPGSTYIGGKDKQRRTVVSFGSSPDWVIWGRTRERLPFGGFSETRCTSTKSFARWAEAESIN